MKTRDQASIVKDFAGLTRKERMKILKGSIVPRPIAWITTVNSDGSVNLAPFSHFSLLSSSLVSVSFTRRADGEGKDTLKNLLREKEAVVHIPHRALIEATDLTSDPLPPNVSEVTKAGLTLAQSSSISTPGIREARIRLETVLHQHLPLTDLEEQQVEADLVILRVKLARLDPAVYDLETGYISHDALDPLTRLGGPYYGASRIIEGFTRKFTP